jgi:hypothetical protein
MFPAFRGSMRPPDLSYATAAIFRRHIAFISVPQAPELQLSTSAE